MIFKSGRYRVKKIIKKTKAFGFSLIKEGDILIFEINLKPTIKRNGMYATDVRTLLGRTMNRWDVTQNNFLNRIASFELEEIVDES